MSRKDIRNKREAKIAYIIKIATAVFAKKGYEGAFLDEIANRAGISKQSIYYYVGDKITLYNEVLKKLLNDVIHTIKYDIDSGLPPDDNMKAFVQRTAQLAHDFHPLHCGRWHPEHS